MECKSLNSVREVLAPGVGGVGWGRGPCMESQGLRTVRSVSVQREMVTQCGELKPGGLVNVLT